MPHSKYDTGLDEIGGAPMVQGTDSEGVGASSDGSDSHNEYTLQQETGRENKVPVSGEGSVSHGIHGPNSDS